MRTNLLRGSLVVLTSLGGFSTQAQEIRSAVPAQQSPAQNGLSRAAQLDKAGTHLERAFLEYRRHIDEGRTSAFQPSNRRLPFADGRVLVDVRANGSGDVLLADLERLGLTRGARAGEIVSGLLPLAALGDAVALSSLRSIVASPAPIRNSGSITSQGDIALRAVGARVVNGVDGTGVSVGVLSDAYDTLGGAATDIATGDLPADGVLVINGESPYCGSLIFCVDEGRAMLQIVHDLAPAADLLFANALGGIAAYATAIQDLAAAGADVLVDDLMYLNEPWFQDGAVAQAVDAAVAGGAAYFSAAGNAGRASMEAPFNDSGVIFCIEFFYPIGDCDPIFERVGRMHDFDAGPGTDLYQDITVPVNSVLTIGMQWNQPFGGPGPATDHDIVLLDETGGIYFELSANDNVAMGESWELLQFQNHEVLGYGDKFKLIITYDDVDSLAPGATLLKTIIFGNASFDEHSTNSPTLVGHANARGSQAVGAAFFAETPEYGVSPPLREPYSSAGGVPILFDPNGVALGAAEFRAKPEITATDGVNTTFFFSDSYGNDGIDDFFGTSAAAPHAAAVAALMLDASPGAAPQQLLSALQASAIDMDQAGFDHDSGAGLIQADAAVAELLASGGNVPPSASFSAQEFGLFVEFTDTSNDADGSIVSWDWRFGDGNTSSARHPSHTYAAAGSYQVTLTIADDAGAVDAAVQTIIVDDGSGNAPPVANFSYSCTARNCSFDGTLSSDDAGVAAYSWDFGDGNVSLLAAPSHSYASQGSYTVSLTVTDSAGTTDSAIATIRVKNGGTLSGSTTGDGDTVTDGGDAERGRKKCTDGVDNDGDGLIDAADTDCQ